MTEKNNNPATTKAWTWPKLVLYVFALTVLAVGKYRIYSYTKNFDSPLNAISLSAALKPLKSKAGSPDAAVTSSRVDSFKEMRRLLDFGARRMPP